MTDFSNENFIDYLKSLEKFSLKKLNNTKTTETQKRLYHLGINKTLNRYIDIFKDCSENTILKKLKKDRILYQNDKIKQDIIGHLISKIHQKPTCVK